MKEDKVKSSGFDPKPDKSAEDLDMLLLNFRKMERYGRFDRAFLKQLMELEPEERLRIHMNLKSILKSLK